MCDRSTRLPECLSRNPVVKLSNDPRPNSMRFRLGPKTVVLTEGGFEHFVSILVECPDPDNLFFDFIRYDSGTCEACNIRASICRIRDTIEGHFEDEPDTDLARNVIFTPSREKTYRLHPGLQVRTALSVREIDPRVVRPAILAKLLEKFPPEGA